MKPVYSWALTIICALGLFAPDGLANAQNDSLELDGGWVIFADPRVDLWYHGLAMVGLNADEEFPLYNTEYIDRVRAAKAEMGIAPTPLDAGAERLREELEKDPAFQLFHFIPLYFPNTSIDRMFQALRAVADRNTRDSTVAGRDTRAGMRLLEGTFRDGNHRRWLREFVTVLEQEWNLFYRDYRASTTAGDATYLAVLQRRWQNSVAPAISDFLASERLDSGRIYIVPSLGVDGRSFEGNDLRRTVNAMAVWAPAWGDPRASLYSVVRELCYSTGGRAVQSAGRPANSVALGRAAVQCGARLLGHVDSSLAAEYREIYVRAMAPDTAQGELSEVFGETYSIDQAVLDSLDVRLGISTGTIAPEPPPPTRWQVETKPQVDLWYHVLAVAAADEPGPLGLYSAEYATVVREAKQELGIYPTKLDSVAADLRRDVINADTDVASVFHFLPLYFQNASPERMLEGLMTVARGRADRMGFGGGDIQFGMLQASRAILGGRERRILRDLVEIAENEWEVFYRDYWEQMIEEQQPRYEAVQTVWDTLFAPQLAPYLERRRLTGGIIIPSPPVGPEGRIVEFDTYIPTDQIVSVQVRLSSAGPDATIFAFLKELCFLLVDDTELLIDPNATYNVREDIRRRAAVRCGALILQFYAPTLVASYRRTFLDAVGADESYSVAAFERVYDLEPGLYDRLREQIRRRRR